MKPLHQRHAQELREMWHCRVLVATRGKDAAVVIAMLFASVREAMPVLLRVAFPGFRGVKPPFFAGHARIVKTGQVVCNMIDRFGRFHRSAQVYASEDDLIKMLRDLADRIKLNDDDRAELFMAASRWLVADYRVNENGEKASA